MIASPAVRDFRHSLRFLCMGSVPRYDEFRFHLELDSLHPSSLDSPLRLASFRHFPFSIARSMSFSFTLNLLDSLQSSLRAAGSSFPVPPWSFFFLQSTPLPPPPLPANYVLGPLPYYLLRAFTATAKSCSPRQKIAPIRPFAGL